MSSSHSSVHSRIQYDHENKRSIEHISHMQTEVHEDSIIDPVEHYTRYPNRWSRVREWVREPAAEFFGVMILIIFGNGVDCQTVLGSNPNISATPKGDYLSLSFGWAVGTALGVWVSGGISGGHINPAVTIAFAVCRDFPWRKVPAYVFAQLMGGLCGAGIVYANYIHAIDIVEGGRNVRTVPGTAGLFSTYALDYMTSVSCFFNEFVGTAVLLIVVCAVTDAKNGPPPAGLMPLVLFITILGIGAALGMQTGYAINPARDLGPRLLTSMVGYGKEVYTFRNHYWLWCPVIATIVGAIFGTFVYDLLFFTGAESIVNKPSRTARMAHVRAENAERQKPIAGVDSSV